jgi:hypothetical protein
VNSFENLARPNGVAAEIASVEACIKGTENKLLGIEKSPPSGAVQVVIADGNEA